MSAPACAPPDLNPKRPDVPTPSGACDCHSHVFGPAERFPYAERRSYTPPDAPVEKLIVMHDVLGFEHAVLVQGAAHGTDNSAMLDALARFPERFRGVAVAPADTSDAELERMAALGVKGLRFNHMFRGGQLSMSGGVTIDAFFELESRMVALDWHLQLWIDCLDLPELWPRIERANARIIVDHMGRMDAHHGVEHPGFRLLVDLVREGRVWVKLSGAYRISEAYPQYADARPFHEALVGANSERCVWGSDWPHPRHEGPMPNTGVLLNLFNAWTPDEELRRRILVDNPTRFYGFDELAVSR